MLPLIMISFFILWIAQRIYEVVNVLERVNYLIYDMQIHTNLSENLHDKPFFV